MSVESSVFPFVLLDLSLFLDEILMPRDSPPIMQGAKSSFSTRLCKVLFMQRSGFLCTNSCKVLWSKLCLDPHVPGNALPDVLGNIVRWCASSLLGSYIHQELI